MREVSKQKQVRERVVFPYYWQGKSIPIMVYVGDKVLLDTGRYRTDEGWSREAAQFEFDGETVTLERFSEGRDCDGYLSSNDRLTCPVSDLAAHFYEDDGGATKHAPLWQRKESEVCDAEAQRAGY